ncbi:hypothetical protein PPL_03335 [Heterostelium album PN500]|uniref:Uncharacterized protein n=1 Tax=Heterostelium pallidum (strain ATCC 26659 / Pp 5 / PN500) TaxID=670386 RepID=D3B4L0_HETP5|nr:hypothetical protein PPL_03335 [Heterostelium album PN500]EFA84258.1 hypothetical protein PPL_03335 [Heterostelium album PN500]|eukprot:XP_020436374.1 hypothetical protein PPL_03335 [Heterostelium album PN500]
MGQSQSIEAVIVDQSSEASFTIDRLRERLNMHDDEFKSGFDNESETAMKGTGAKDLRTISSNKDLKIEFSSEYNYETVRKIVSLSLKTASSPYGDNLELTEETINSFAELVANFYDYSKKRAYSRSTSFDLLMNRVLPGFFVCVGCSSLSLKEDLFFGTEIVVATAFFYKIMVSIDDIKKEDRNNTIVMKTKVIEIMKSVQVQNLRNLVDGVITKEEWYAIEDRTTKAIEKLQKELNQLCLTRMVSQLISPISHSGLIYTSPPEISLENQANESLSNSNLSPEIVELFKKRLGSGYFNQK